MKPERKFWLICWVANEKPIPAPPSIVAMALEGTPKFTMRAAVAISSTTIVYSLLITLISIDSSC